MNRTVRRLLISSMNLQSSRCTSESAAHLQTAPFSSLPSACMRSEDIMTDLFTDGSSEYPSAGSKHHSGRKRSCSHRRRLSTRTMDSTNTSSNAASLTASSDETLEEFCSRPWIKESINNPWHPNSVLSFFTGINCADPKCYKELLRRSKLSEKIYPLNVISDGEKYYKICQPFAPVIRSAGRGELVSSEWTSVDGIVAQIVLCSQLAKSCFRGSPEAYAYTERSVSLSKELHRLAASLLKSSSTSVENKTDYKRLRNSFASMSILAATYSSAAVSSSSNTQPTSRSSRKSSTVSTTRTRTTSAGSQKSLGSSRLNPPDCITLCSSSTFCVSSSRGDGDASVAQSSISRSPSDGSISAVSIDDQLAADELESIVEGGEEYEVQDFF